MPCEWYDRHAVNLIEDEEKRRFYLSIVADRKPYFMQYIYPAVMREYREYVKSAEKNAVREFRMSLAELEALPKESMTERQSDFLRYYHARMPVGLGDCVMNKICRRFEEEFDGILRKQNGQTPFDYSILKGNNTYTKAQKTAVKKLYDTYTERLQKYKMYSSYEHVEEYEAAAYRAAMLSDFRRECDCICPSAPSLCDLVLDICYHSSSTKKFAWDLCSKDIINNLLDRSGRTLRFPVLDEDGDFVYAGNRFSMKELKLEEELNEHNPE